MQIAELPGRNIAYLDEAGTGSDDKLPILLIHGFASNAHINWVGPGWLDALTKAGHRVIALDNRGHGQSSKFYEGSDYSLQAMASDAIALLDYLEIGHCHLMGYSMGARISARLAIDHGSRFDKVILGGNGYSIIEGSGDWTPVSDALLTDDPATITDPRGLAFRTFADQTGSDLKALATCVTSVRQVIPANELETVQNPVLIAIGTRDDVAGSGEKLEAVLPNAQFLPIPNRDHMRAVGDKVYIQGVLDFLSQ